MSINRAATSTYYLSQKIITAFNLAGNAYILPKVLGLSVEWMIQLGKTVKRKRKL